MFKGASLLPPTCTNLFCLELLVQVRQVEIVKEVLVVETSVGLCVECPYLREYSVGPRCRLGLGMSYDCDVQGKRVLCALQFVLGVRIGRMLLY